MPNRDPAFSVYWSQSLKSVLSEFTPAALVNIDGSTVHIEVSKVSDLSLSACAQFCHQYLKMKVGDMAIVNDPSSGGSSLNEISLVRAIALTMPPILGGNCDFLICTRFEVGGTNDPSSAVNTLKIPPTPIAFKDVINNEILHAVALHPGASTDLIAKINLNIEKLKLLEQKLLRIKSLAGLSFSSDQLGIYFDTTKKSLLSWISKNLANGEFQFQHKLKTGETIKLRIECKENENILFDFIGTGNSESLQLTEHLTFAACFSSLISLSNFEIPANQGSYSALQLRTPQNSMLNSKQIRNTFAATHLHAIELSKFLRTSLLKLTRSHKNFAEDSNGVGPCSIIFGAKSIWSFHMPGGQGASSESEGGAIFSPWSGHAFNDFSVEQIEKNFPVRIHSLAKRKSNLGKGAHYGGAGAHLILSFLKDAELEVSLENERTQGQSGGKAGERSEIRVEFQESQEEIKTSFKQSIKPGTILHISSGGGGGWGEEKIEEDED